MYSNNNNNRRTHKKKTNFDVYKLVVFVKDEGTTIKYVLFATRIGERNWSSDE